MQAWKTPSSRRVVVAPSLVLVGAALVGPPPAAMAQKPPDYGFTFHTVGAPGNASYAGLDIGLNNGVGSVGYAYRISENEVTVSQWLEFVRAFAPYWDGDPQAFGLVGTWIRYDNGSYNAVPGTEQAPADMSWRMAARYVNWLNNGKGSGAAAFRQGAYDTSTFAPNAAASGQITHFTDQLAHSTSAQYWIPTQDEWIKAAYFDPNRFGAGFGGYWLYPNGSNTALVTGLPDQGGQTNAGLANLLGPSVFLPVGAYPEVRSPWGLLDVSGGLTEWTETASDDRNIRIACGTGFGDIIPHINDQIDWNHHGSTPYDTTAIYGLRIASQAPAPGLPLADYIACYFSVPPCSRADFNNDSVVDPDDLADFIAAYFCM